MVEGGGGDSQGTELPSPSCGLLVGLAWRGCSPAIVQKGPQNPPGVGKLPAGVEGRKRPENGPARARRSPQDEATTPSCSPEYQLGRFGSGAIAAMGCTSRDYQLSWILIAGGKWGLASSSDGGRYKKKNPPATASPLSMEPSSRNPGLILRALVSTPDEPVSTS